MSCTSPHEKLMPVFWRTLLGSSQIACRLAVWPDPELEGMNEHHSQLNYGLGGARPSANFKPVSKSRTKSLQPSGGSICSLP
jgi:hypothetical protein